MSDRDVSPVYVVRRVAEGPSLLEPWDGTGWAPAPALRVKHFHPNSSDHHPETWAKMVYSDRGVHGVFTVNDRYVRCINLEYQSPVYMDACVEFFVKPKPDRGYMNFEMNCSGALLLQYVVDPTRTETGFVDYEIVPPEIGLKTHVRGTFDGLIDPEIVEPVPWTLSFHIPFEVFEHYVGPVAPVAGQEWRANFNKCAVNNSHPHWGTWSPIGERFEFHQPEKFGVLRFEA